MRTGVAYASTWRGPYVKRTSTAPMPVPGGCEDAAVYVSPSGVYRVIFHCGCQYLVAHRCWAAGTAQRWERCRKGPPSVALW
eukprot:gene16494-46898_t